MGAGWGEGERGVVHGGLDPAELVRHGLDPAQVSDFSSNLNPWGPPPAAIAAARAAPLDRYPDRQAGALVAALAEHVGVDHDRILVGNGAAELIYALTAALARPDERVAVLGPTFGEYAAAAEIVAADVVEWRRPEPDFALDVASACALIRERRPRLVWLCSPNNPTGDLADGESVAQIARAAAVSDGWLVVDESFRAFAPEAPDLRGLLGARTLLLRSLTKEYALAGLRLGYLLGEPEALGRIARRLPPWNVSAPAQAAGVAALGEIAWLAESLARSAAAKERLVAGLRALDLAVWPGTANFVLVEVGDAARLREWLLRQGLLLRDCASFGLPRHVRLAVRPPEEGDRLLATLARWREST